jgi:hypothetical protein
MTNNEDEGRPDFLETVFYQCVEALSVPLKTTGYIFSVEILEGKSEQTTCWSQRPGTVARRERGFIKYTFLQRLFRFEGYVTCDAVILSVAIPK